MSRLETGYWFLPKTEDFPEMLEPKNLLENII